MTIEERIMQTVGSLGWTITQIPVTGSGDRYASFEVVSGTTEGFGSDCVMLLRWVLYLHLWTRRQLLTEDVKAVIRALSADGMQTDSWGPAIYEDDTGWYHFPLTVAVGEVI